MSDGGRCGPTVLALRTAGLGDLLTAVPALRALTRMARPGRLVLATTPWLVPVVELLGGVDVVVPAGPELGPLPAVVHHADLAVNLHGRGPRSTRRLAATRPRQLVAYGLPGAPAWDDDEHEVTRWCRLLRAAGIDAAEDDLALTPPPRTAAPQLDPDTTLLHLGASSGARRWLAAGWAVVAAREHRAGRPVVLTGAADDVAASVEVARAAGLPDRAVLAGRTGLTELVALVAHAGRVVSGDTGVAHLATAFATPSVVLFGPVPPSRWGPPASGPHVVLWKGTTGDPHATTTDPGLARITPEEVLDAIDRLPVAAGGGPR